MNSFLEKYFSAIKKYLPEPVLKSSFGLDIGSGSCKFAEIIPKDDSFELVSYAIEPIKNGHVIKAVQDILNKFNVQSKSICTALAGQGTLIRYIEMPRMSLEDLKKSFHIEADRYFPFPKEQIYTDCYILNAKSRGNKMTVLVAAAKRDMLDKRLGLLSQLQLQTHFVGLNPIAIANVFHVLNQTKKAREAGAQAKEEEGACALLDMGEVTSNLLILKDNMPRFSRDIFTGGRDITKRMCNLLGVDPAEAENVIRNPKDNEEQVLTAVDAVVHNLCSELRLSFDYFITENNLPVERLLLTGGMSSLPKIKESMKNYLEIPVEQWNPAEFLYIGEHVEEESFRRDVHQLGVALGLALYQY